MYFIYLTSLVNLAPTIPTNTDQIRNYHDDDSSDSDVVAWFSM